MKRSSRQSAAENSDVEYTDELPGGIVTTEAQQKVVTRRVLTNFQRAMSSIVGFVSSEVPTRIRPTSATSSPSAPCVFVAEHSSRSRAAFLRTAWHKTLCSHCHCRRETVQGDLHQEELLRARGDWQHRRCAPARSMVIAGDSEQTKATK